MAGELFLCDKELDKGEVQSSVGLEHNVILSSQCGRNPPSPALTVLNSSVIRQLHLIVLDSGESLSCRAFKSMPFSYI